MKKYLQFLNEDKDNGILFIVDVQKEFEKFIPQGFIDQLINYCKKFHTVYQIWDSNDANKPSFTFPNQKSVIIKKFGTKFSDELEDTVAKLNKKHPDAKEGEIFEFDDVNSYVVKITNNHTWFYVPEKMAELFKSLKGRNVIIVGGAGSTNPQFYLIKTGNVQYDNGECIKDVYQAMKSFGINVQYDTRYIYNAKTNNTQNYTKDIKKLIQ
jgi:hypothetical protein